MTARGFRLAHVALESHVASVPGDYTQKLDVIENMCNDFAMRYGYSCSIHSANVQIGDAKLTLALKCRDGNNVTICYAKYSVASYVRLIDFYCYKTSDRL